MSNYKEVFQLAHDKGFKSMLTGDFDRLEEVIKANPARQNLLDDTILIHATLIQKWLRDEYNLSMWAFQEKRLDAGFVVYKDGKLIAHNTGRMRTYEEAMLAGIEEALKLIK